MNKPLPMCECGCGEPVTKVGNRFINGHSSCKTPWKPKPVAQLCKCGCGELANPGYNYIKGHDKRGENNPMKNPDIAKKASNSHKKRCSEPKVRKEMSDRFIQYNIDHPEKGEAHSKWMIQYCKDPEVLTAMSERQIKFLEEHPEYVDTFSKRIKQFYIDNPEAKKAARLKLIEYWSDQIHRDEMSEIITNSDAAKTNADNMRGGNDICGHHYIYDNSDLSKYTMKMTRSQHQILHMNMRSLGLKVPKINTGYENEEELELMEYINKLKEDQQ